jgi:dethiobiotin synthetase
MTNKCVITGTDTDVGKTVFAAMLMLAFHRLEGACGYWKPVQCGVTGGVDTKTVQTMTGLAAENFLPEKYVLTEALSPHRAAELDNTEIDIDSLEPPDFAGPLLIEGAGGINVPLTRSTLNADLFEMWNLPVILCARTGLGTLNHTLLSVEALQRRNIPIHGITFVGDDNPDNIRTIAEFTGVRILGRLPLLDKLNAQTLTYAFDTHFNMKDFT